MIRERSYEEVNPMNGYTVNAINAIEATAKSLSLLFFNDDPDFIKKFMDFNIMDASRQT
jgi:hypothetical protein